VQNDTLTYDSFGNVSSYVSNPSDVSAREKQCFTYTRRQQLNLAKNVALGVSCANAWSSTSPPARPSTPNFSDNYDYTLFGGIESGLSGVNTYGSAAHPHAVMETTAGQREMTYNAAGELEFMTSVSGAVTRSEDYVWDRLGRLSSTTVDSTTGGVTSRLTSVYNRYDVDRQRVLRIEDKPGTAPDSVTVFLPGMDVTVTVDAAGVRSHKISRYASIAGTTVAVRSVTTGGGWTIDWLLGNHQGSITAAVRSGTGAVTRNWFDPYGGERGSSTMVTDRDFLGQETDTAVGLSYLNNRYYDPTVGMFLSVDPLVAKTGEAYVYGSGNPITLSDPSGLEPVGGHQEVDKVLNDCLRYSGCSAEMTTSALVHTRDGRSVFAYLDVAKEGDLEKIDGNLSSDDISAASDPSRLDYVGDELTAAVIQSVAQRLDGRKDLWDAIDRDLSFFEQYSSWIAGAGFVLSALSFTGVCTIVCGVAAAAVSTHQASQVCAAGSQGCGLAVGAAALSVVGVGNALPSLLLRSSSGAGSAAAALGGRATVSVSAAEGIVISGSSVRPGLALSSYAHRSSALAESLAPINKVANVANVIGFSQYLEGEPAQ
jgi:RHS repeat-associated protein